MAQNDPFNGLGPALARLRERAGFAKQVHAADALKIDRGQLSRWENDNPRPTLENLSRLLAGYGLTVGDLAVELGVAVVPPGVAAEAKSAPGAEGVGGGSAEKRVPTDEELIRSLAEAIRRVEGRQVETESRMERIVERIGGL